MFNLSKEYIRNYGNSYNVVSKNNEELMNIFNKVDKMAIFADFMSEISVLGTYSKQGGVLIKPDE